MPKVVSLTRRERFEFSEISLPAGWDFFFLTDYREKAIIDACLGADFMLVPASHPPLRHLVLENIPSVLMIQSDGAGYDHIDLDSAARLGIVVANSPGQNASAVAELTIGMAIALQRQMVAADGRIKAGEYLAVRQQILAQGIGEIRDSWWGIVGMGAIGQLTAKMARLMGAHIAYYDPNRATAELERELDAQYKDLDSLLAESNIVSLHLPLTPATRGLIGERELRLMPAGAYLINTSRGEIVDQDALAHSLAAGHLGGAAIDTVFPEPMPADHPFLTVPGAQDRLLITPHTGGLTVGALRRMQAAALANLERVWRGEQPWHIVNGVNQVNRWKKRREGSSEHA